MRPLYFFVQTTRHNWSYISHASQQGLDAYIQCGSAVVTGICAKTHVTGNTEQMPIQENSKLMATNKWINSVFKWGNLLSALYIL